MYDPAYHREYYIKNKERKRSQADAWAQANPDKVKESARRTRKKRAELGKDVAVRQAWEGRNREYVLWNAAKQRCKKSGVDFLISKEEVVIPDVCPFLGIRINREARGRMQPNSPSLDRIDNSKGYIPGNVQVISWKANRMKCDATLDELMTFAISVQKWMGK